MSSLARNLSLAAAAGILGGLASATFLIALESVAKAQRSEIGLLYFLPVAGLLVGGLYDRFGGRAGQGTNLVIGEIHAPTTRLPGRTTPLIFFTTLASHLFGASVGREGAAIQMGASLSDQLSRFFHLSPEDRRVLLKAGAAAGFAGALGAPLAGLIFGMEFVTKNARFKPRHLAECAIAAFTAYGVSHALGAPHTLYGALPPLPLFSPKYLAAAAGLGLLTGLLVRVFIHLTEVFSQMGKLYSGRLAVRAFTGAFVLIGLTFVFGNRDSLGLGIPEIQSAFLSSSPLPLALEKLVMTAISIASGFRGGEFVPLLFIGATGASAAAVFFSVPTAFAAACGVASSFGSAARVPFALSVFAAEHFTPNFLLYALIANATARLMVGAETSIYTGQKNSEHA